MQDNDRVAKYIRLFGTIFLTVVGFILSLVLLLLFFNLFFGLLNKFSITQFIFNLIIIVLPGCFFITICIYYWKRTKNFPVKSIKYISYFIFCVMIGTWAFALVKDLIKYFQLGTAELHNFQSFELYMLAGSVFLIFLTGIIQALTLPDEEDWLKKAQKPIPPSA